MNNKSVWAVIIIVVIVLVGGGLLLANKNSDNNPTPKNNSSDMSHMNSTNNSNSDNNTSATTTPVATNKVDIKDFAYSPATITVKVGDTVTWTNQDSTSHTVTTSDGPEQFDSGSIDQGKTFTHTFTKAGTYKYHCTFHPSMPTATVIVTES
jgi:plastocyanin